MEALGLQIPETSILKGADTKQKPRCNFREAKTWT